MKRNVETAARKIINATVINYEGDWVINVEDGPWDAIESAHYLNQGHVASGYFAEPINLALVGIYKA